MLPQTIHTTNYIVDGGERMDKGIELRLRYIDLVREGKDQEAWKVLNEIWTYDKNPNKTKTNKSKIKPTKQKEVEPKIKLPSKFKTIRDLEKIHGVGTVTVTELEERYESLEELIKVMKGGKNLVTLDYIEEKIKKELKI